MISIKKVLIYGAECTGKSTLAEQLAKHFKTVFIPDPRRLYIKKNDYCFIYNDLKKIAQIHVKTQQKAEKKANKIYFIDTDAITLSIYSESYFQNIDPEFEKIINKQNYDLILFTHSNIPWVEDHMRDYGDANKRKELHKTFKDELKKRGLKYVDIKSKFWDKRLDTAINAVNKLLLEGD